MFFEDLIRLLCSRPMVPGKTAECLRRWETFDAQQQQQIYETIRDKLQAGKFVHYDPLKAIEDNTPKGPKTEILSFNEYYSRYGTTEETDGWHMENPTGNRVIFVKTT